MMRPGRCCALDIRRGCISRERWQIVFAHLRSGLVTGGEFDQGRFLNAVRRDLKPPLRPIAPQFSEDRCQRIFFLAFAFPI